MDIVGIICVLYEHFIVVLSCRCRTKNKFKYIRKNRHIKVFIYQHWNYISLHNACMGRIRVCFILIIVGTCFSIS